MPRVIACLIAATTLSAACRVDDGSDDVVVEQFENEGSLCFSSLEGAGDERIVHVLATFPACLSSSCSERLDTGCEITRDGDTLRIESSGSVAHHGGTCTSDCQSLSAQCASQPLPAGEYTVAYGDRTGTITLPTEGSGLFGSGPAGIFCVPPPGGSGGSGGAAGGGRAGTGGGGAGAGGAGGSAASDAGQSDGGAPLACENGEIVDSIAGCLQDDAFCYELDDGRYCTGPAPSMCPDGWMPLDPNAQCPDGNECFEYSLSLWCTRPLEPAQRCAPHDAHYTGTCEPAERFYWTGISCVGRTGCSCSGDDCDQGFASLQACETEFAGCADETVFCGGRLGNTCGDDEYCAYVPELLCGAADASSICQPRPAGCDDNYEPVCGCDGMTYPNACEAHAAGTGLSSHEPCN